LAQVARPQLADNGENNIFKKNNNDDGKHRLTICLHFLSIYFIELDKGYI
jgi:hypothetical protein